MTGTMKTLQDLLHTFAGNSNPALIAPQKTPIKVSYNDLFNQVQYLRAELALLGLNRGTRLSIILPHSVEFVALFLAISCMRATAAPLNPGLKQDEYAFYLEYLSPSAIITTGEAFRERHAAVLAALDKGVSIIECRYSEGQITLDDKYGGRTKIEATRMLETPAEQDVAILLLTSGTTSTTGRPRVVSALTLALLLRQIPYHDKCRLLLPTKIFSHQWVSSPSK